MMVWDLEEAVAYHRSQGAPGDQNAVIALLRETQQAFGGSIPEGLLAPLSRGLGVKESYLNAIIRRIPSLKVGQGHLLELCAGPNCSKHTHLATLAEALAAGKPVTVKFVPCMRLCGKGPNLKWDGRLYHRADEALLRELLK